MTMNQNDQNIQNPQSDGGEREHAELVLGLAQLAERDRADTPENLSDRIFVRTQANLGHAADAPPAVFVLRSRSWMRIAAAVLIVGAGVAVVMSLPNGQPSIPEVVESTGTELASAEFNFEFVSGVWDDSLDGEIDLLMAESTMLDGELDREWEEFDFLHDEGAL